MAPCRVCILLAALLAACRPSVSLAQLRPLDPVEWRAFDPGALVVARIGGSVFWDQRASIGGVRGRLVETPAALLSWTTGSDGGPGRVVVRAVFHPVRRFRVDSAYTSPVPGTTELTGRIRDTGDNALETIVRLSPDRSVGTGGLLAARYGVRISTHHDKRGLDRHKTDVYATLVARRPLAGWSVAGEAGFGVYGTRQPGSGKALPFLYSAEARRAVGPLEPSLGLAGQASRRQLRGNEDLSELRAGVRVGGSRWLEATLVRGLARHSPSAGLLLFAGIDLHRRAAGAVASPATTRGGGRP
jgi:hypothetical protein